MSVKYKELKDFPGYRVGSDGSFWSKRVKIAAGQGFGSRSIVGDTWRQLTLKPDEKGYKRAWIYGVGNIPLHRVVLEAFVGQCPLGMEGCHNDGNPSNNDISNLRWGTYQDNALDRLKHGTDNRGSKHPNSKLTEDDVRAIRKERAEKSTTYECIGKKYGVHRENIFHIIKNRSWKHVT